MFRRIVSAAALAGLVAGLLLAAMQQWLLGPLLRRAEVLEGAAHGEPVSLLAGIGASVALATGFALLLAAAFSLHGRPGWRAGLGWGLAGYAVFFVAPSLGLPPELPGMHAAALQDRQLWWLATAGLTAAGLALVVFSRLAALRVLGVTLVLAPHVVGAPQPEVAGGTAPAELVEEFTRAAYFANGVFWLALGTLVGAFFRR